MGKLFLFIVLSFGTLFHDIPQKPKERLVVLGEAGRGLRISRRGAAGRHPVSSLVTAGRRTFAAPEAGRMLE
jgi:hypothetical protein